MADVHYCAFISYRHVSPDQEIAAKLHGLIERYTVPKALRDAEGNRHPGKVFRDQEELPLSPDLGRDIETALDNSDYLICVCTPRYLESRWCMREVEYFIAKHGREKVLALLAEGEPDVSFPDRLRFEEQADGTRVETEPLAADVRGGTLRAHLKKLKKEKLRILAPMLSSTYDGLYQRARRRRLRNGLAAAVAALLLAGGFLAYALVQNARLAVERETAAKNEMDLLVEKSLSRTAENRKQEARDLALAARDLSLTLDGYGEERVRDALAVTCYAGDFAVETELKIPGVYAEYYRYSPDGKKIAAVVASSAVFCFDAVSGEELWNCTPSSMMLTSLEWKPDSSALVVTSTTGHMAAILDGADGHVVRTLGFDWAGSACFDGDHILVCGSPGIVFWDPASEEEQIPLIYQDENNSQQIVSFVSENGRSIIRVDYLRGRIQLAYIPDSCTGTLEPTDPRMISSVGLSPDGQRLYVRQGRLLALYHIVTGEEIWSREAAEGELGGNLLDIVSEAVWSGDRIFDCGVILNAADGETVARTDETRAVVSADLRYFLCTNGIYRVSDGSLFCSLPGELLAVDPTGETLLLKRELPSRDLMPGHGSTRTAEKYEGTLLDVPDWTNPMEGYGVVGVYDPVMWGSTDSTISSRMLISPDTRFYVMINAANHTKIFDMEIGNEPVHRIYGYPTNALGISIGDASFSPDSRRLALAGDMGQFGVYDLETGQLLHFWDELYGKISLEGIRFNGDGTLVMVAGYMNRRFRVCSVENGLVLYDLYPEKTVSSWGFDETTGDAVVLYEDGSALIADIFTSGEELYAYAVK